MAAAALAAAAVASAAAAAAALLLMLSLCCYRNELYLAKRLFTVDNCLVSCGLRPPHHLLSHIEETHH